MDISNKVLLCLLKTYIQINNRKKINKCLVLLLKEKGCRIKCFMSTVSNYNEVEFRSHFRLSRSSVEILSTKIINRYEGNYILGQKRISFYRALLMTLWYLSNNETFRQLGDRFDVARGNACRTVHYLIDIICTACDDFIIWPKGSNLRNVANSFNTLRVNNFPNVIGAIDGCHIRITVPLNKRKDYTNRKMFQSIVLLAVCKSNLEFTYVFAGWPGSSHDARVYRNSTLGKCLTADDCTLFPTEYHILGDSAFPLSKRLLTPYRQREILTPTQTIYNKRLSSTRVVIKQAFGLLLGRFRRLKSVCMKNVDNISKAVTACCILHNIALNNDDYTWVPIDSTTDTIRNEFVNDGFDNQQDITGINKRNSLASLF